MVSRYCGRRLTEALQRLLAAGPKRRQCYGKSLLLPAGQSSGLCPGRPPLAQPGQLERLPGLTALLDGHVAVPRRRPHRRLSLRVHPLLFPLPVLYGLWPDGADHLCSAGKAIAHPPLRAPQERVRYQLLEGYDAADDR